MLLADEPNIREVIAFPMNQKAQDLLMNAPCEVEHTQLRELNLQLKPSKKIKFQRPIVNNRINNCFAKLKMDQKAFIAYISAGDPDLSSTIDITLRLEDSGVDILNLDYLFLIH